MRFGKDDTRCREGSSSRTTNESLCLEGDLAALVRPFRVSEPAYIYLRAGVQDMFDMHALSWARYRNTRESIGHGCPTQALCSVRGVF